MGYQRCRWQNFPINWKCCGCQGRRAKGGGRTWDNRVVSASRQVESTILPRPEGGRGPSCCANKKRCEQGGHSGRGRKEARRSERNSSLDEQPRGEGDRRDLEEFKASFSRESLPSSKPKQMVSVEADGRVTRQISYSILHRSVCIPLLQFLARWAGSS